jgi:hypothetical protein
VQAGKGPSFEEGEQVLRVLPPPDMIQQAVYKFLAEATGLRRLHASYLPLASKTNFMRELSAKGAS